MNRQNPNHKPVSSLRRQHSMKTEDYSSSRSNTALSNDRNSGLIYRPHSGYVTSLEVSPTNEYRTYNRPDHSATVGVQPTSVSPRYLTVLDHGSSAHSSLVAVSRVSQQPSFESYDSSVSAVSWTSSNDPEGTGGQNRNPKQKTTPKTDEALNKSPATSNEKTEENKFKKTESDTSLLRRLSRPKDILRFYKRAPLNRAQTMSSESHAEQVTIEAFRTASQSPTIGRSRKLWGSKLDRTQSVQKSTESIKTSETGSFDLKVIGLKKENPNDIKPNASAVAPNMKGLWKRAFQSLRKDKNERDTGSLRRKDTQASSADNQSSEGEVDPVYHLLRCAASKSQTTVSATSGIQTPRSTSKVKSPNAEGVSLTPPEPTQVAKIDSGKPSDPNLFQSGLRKKPSFVTFKPTGSDQYDSGLIPDHGTVDYTEEDRLDKLDPEDADLYQMDPMASRLPKKILTSTEESRVGTMSEAELAYEQHKRTNARQKMGRLAQRSPTFRLDEESNDECVPHYNNEPRPHFDSNTMEQKAYKSGMPTHAHNIGLNRAPQIPFNCTPNTSSNEEDLETNRQLCGSGSGGVCSTGAIRSPAATFAPANEYNNYTMYQKSTGRMGSGLRKLSPHVHSKRIQEPEFEEDFESELPSTSREYRTRRVPLLSTKSFSLDVPRCDRRLEPGFNASGDSSPGRHYDYPSSPYQNKSSEARSVGKSLSPVSIRQKDPLFWSRGYGMSNYDQFEESPTTSIELNRSAHMNMVEEQIGSHISSSDEQIRRYPKPSDTTDLHMSSQARIRVSPPGNYRLGPGQRSNMMPRILPKPVEQQSERNIYVAKKDFIARRRNELNLRPGYYVNVLESSDNMWWYGICDGKMGYFPSAYVKRLMPGADARFQ